MLSIYPACFFKEETGYSVIFPDLNLATCGETINEAMTMAVDCLAGRLHWLKKDGDAIPEPSSMNNIDPVAIAKDLEIEASESFVSMVSVDKYYRRLCLQKYRRGSTYLITLLRLLPFHVILMINQYGKRGNICQQHSHNRN